MTHAPSVLAATDFSEMAQWAVDRAARLSRQWNHRLILTHVLPRSAMDSLREWLGSTPGPEHRLVDEDQHALRKAASELTSRLGVSVTTHTCVGSPPEALAQRAQAEMAGLIVVGARGASPLRRMALGTTSERLLRRTPTPLLVVRNPARERYSRVAVAVDFSAWSAAAVTLARQVAGPARLLLIAVFEVPFHEKLRFAGVDAATIDHYRRQARQDTTHRLHALAHACGLRAADWEPCVVEGDASQRIVEQLASHRCDLAVLGKHGQSVAEDLLLGSVTLHVLAESDNDVLISTGRASA